uniref:PB1 domain-containing protein n=1 Tax=Glossina pallidipes TaxID=7398 RepID=A0A1B0AGH1_GLOPL
VKTSATVGFLRLRLRDINKFTTLLETFSKRYSVEPKDNRFTLFADEFKLDCVVSAADTFEELSSLLSSFERFSKQVKEVCCWELLTMGPDISFLSADSLSVLSESLPSSTSISKLSIDADSFEDFASNEVF